MVHLTLAVGDFMLMLITAGLWVAAGIAACVAGAVGAFGGVAALMRRRRR